MLQAAPPRHEACSLCNLTRCNNFCSGSQETTFGVHGKPCSRPSASAILGADAILRYG